MVRQEDRIQGLADFVFAPNHFVEESLRESGVQENQILPSSYGCTVPHKAMVKTDYRINDVLTFLFVGSFSLRKGAHRLLQAWHGAGCPGKLVIAGEIDKIIADQCYALLNHHSIHAIGFKNDINSIYRNADVFVFPSLEEGGPQVSYEAASFGLPMIVTPMGGGRVSQAGKNALIIEPDDTESLQDAIQEIAKSEELRQYLGENARKEVIQYDWQLVSKNRHNLLLENVG